MSDAIDEILQQREAAGLWLGPVQRHRLQQLFRRYCKTVVWDGASDVVDPGVSVVVLNSATAPRMEMLVGSLHENSIVVIPFGENPAFDFLKSKLHAYGSIGSQGTSAPHHIWWGGLKPLNVPTGFYRKEDTLFVTAFKRGALLADKAARLAGDLERQGLDCVVEELPPDSGVDAPCLSKIDFLIRQLEQFRRPIFWIDPEARVFRHPLLPQSLGCDFAVHKRRSGQLEPGALFLHQTEPARALLDIWQRISRFHPDLPEAFLLDQAWTLAASQREIETSWLPDSYCRVGEFLARDTATVIQYDYSSASMVPDDRLILHFQGARRYGRHQAPEAHVIMQGPAPTRGPITVVIRDVLASSTHGVSAAIEAATRAFAADAGGFSQMEVVLCAWDDDVDSVMRIADQTWVLVTDPSERLEPNAFRSLGLSTSLRAGAPAYAIYSETTAQDHSSVLRLVDPSLGAKLKRSGRYRGSLLKRPQQPAGGAGRF